MMTDRLSTAPIATVPVPGVGLLVNGTPLDLLLAEYTGITEIAGLVPTWLDWWAPKPSGWEERAWVEARSALTGGTELLPLLICPDDFDFSCTVLVAEVVDLGDTVSWSRFGFDCTGWCEQPSGAPWYIGGRVEWIADGPVFDFARANYLRCRDAFNATRQPAQAQRA